MKQRLCSRCEISLPDRIKHPSCYCRPCRSLLAKNWAKKYRSKPEPERKPRYDFKPLLGCLTP